MRKRPTHILFIALMICAAALPGMAHAASARILGGTECRPTVTVTVTPDAEVSAWAYEEYVYGLTPSEITENGAYISELGVIRWGMYQDNTERMFSYALSGSDGTYSIYGVESHDGRDTETAVTDVTINCAPPQVVAPTFDPPDGSDVPVTVTITTATEGATIYYTTDGSIPTAASAVYTDPIVIDKNTILRAFATKTDMTDSERSVAVYKKPYVPPADILERSISDTVCLPTVSITVTPKAGTSAYAIEETLSLGLTPQNISDGGLWDAETSTIRWGILLDDTARTFTYELAGPDAGYSLSGTGSFDGRDMDISGITDVTIDCIPDQAEAPVLEPASGTRVPVSVTMTTATEGAEIRYTTDGTEPDELSTLYSAPILLNTATTIKAKAFAAGLAPSETTEAVYRTAQRPKAIIVAGGGPYEGNSLWPATVFVSNYAYRALLYQGYAKEDIQFLHHDLTLDVDGNEELDDIDSEASRANLQDAILNWAADASEVLLYLTDHGGDKAFMIGQTDILSAADLAGWLNTLQDTMPGRTVVIYDACQAGTFVKELAAPVGKERMVITSASNEPALFLEDGVLSFSYQFWSMIFYSGNLYDAYLNGSKLMREDQRSLMDVNGNGIANEKADKRAAADVIIGRGHIAASTPPVIVSHNGDQSISSGTSATVLVTEITSLDPISRVWGVVIPPDYHPGDASKPITELPTLELTDSDSNGTYEGTYTEFSLNGAYRLILYAKSGQGIISPPSRINITQTGGEIPPNAVPYANGMSFDTDEDVPVESTLDGGDSDSDPLTFKILEDGTIGTVSMTDVATGAFTYQPHTNEHGSDSFVYKVNDGKIDSQSATVSITIASLEDVPAGEDLQFEVIRNGTLNGNVVGHDGDGDPITFVIASHPGHGGVTLDDATTGAFTYTPDGNYYGGDSFTFTVSDAKAISQAASVSITVDRGSNVAPTATDTAVEGQEDTAILGTLQGDDLDDDPITFSLVTEPAKGTVELVDPATGDFTYTPDENINGEDSFTFAVSDGLEDSAPATCTITIRPVDDPPVATDGRISVDSVAGKDGQLSGTDVDNDPLTFAIDTNGQLGQAVITDATTGAFTYTPDSTENGYDAFTFTVSDGTATSSSAQVSVNISIPQGEISRDISDGDCLMDVALTVTPVGTVLAYAVEEYISEGLTPKDITEAGLWDANSRTIKWGIFLDATARTLSYSLTGDDGGYDLTGAGSFDGWNADTIGESQVNIACGSLRVATPTFDPPSGTRVPVDVALSSETADAQIHYTTDRGEPTEASDIYSGPIHLDDPTTMKARAYREGMAASAIAQAEYLPTHAAKAIIVAGGGPYAGNSLWNATQMAAEYAYKALIYQGYAKEDIVYLSAGENLDVDGNGALDDVDGMAESAALQDAITNWAIDAENLLLFMTDHGGDGTFLLTPNDVLLAEDLDSWLDALQETMPGPVLIVYDACRSGTFISRLRPEAGKTRITITSADDERAWFIHGGKLSFSYQFWASIFGDANISNAYEKARNLVGGFQNALIDADGDGVSGEEADWLAVKDIKLGRGVVIASIPPVIGHISPSISLESDISTTVTVRDIVSLNDIDRVWAVVTPPAHDGSLLDEPVTEITEIDLADDDNDGSYDITYDGFVEDGIYRIVVYAMDSQGLYSQPAHMVVAKNAELPDEDGDANGNGVVDLTDLVLILQLLSGIDPQQPISLSADVDIDTKIGLAEAIYVMQKVAGLR